MSELLGYPLQFDNDWNDDKLEKMLAPLLNHTHPYLCEWGGCQNKATIEWIGQDEEGTYYTLRCDGHAVKEPDYIAKEL